MVLPPPLDGSNHAVSSSWMQGWLPDASDDERETMIQGIYGLCCARNETRDGKRMPEPRVVAERVFDHIQEWRSVHDKTGMPTEPKHSEQWKPPELGWIKINTDGAMSKAQDNGGGGVILTDHAGAFRGGAAVFFPGVTDPEFSEVLATRRPMQMAQELNVQKVHLELDSKGVVAMLNDKTKNLSAAGPYIEEIKEMLGSKLNSRVSWVRRSANAAARLS